jgi:hypothetical protein
MAGLMAVCQTTACESYSDVHQSCHSDVAEAITAAAAVFSGGGHV